MDMEKEKENEKQCQRPKRRAVETPRAGKLAKKTVSEKICGPFKPPPTRFLQSMERLKKKKCLEEKMTYGKLLEKCQPKTLENSTDTLAEIKPQSPIPMKEPPVINLKKELKSLSTQRREDDVDITSSRPALKPVNSLKSNPDRLEKQEPPVLKIEEVLPSLTEEQEERVRQALKRSPPDEVLAKKFKMSMTRKDIGTLKGLHSLNDEIINFYMELIMARGQGKSLPRVYAFSTFFYGNITKKKFSTVTRWTKKVDLFTYDMVLVPIHMEMHWCMSVIDFRSKEVRYYDSMGADNDHCLNSLLSYLEQESMDKKKQTFDTTGWKKINVEKIPQQMNGSDCGVFACTYAEHLARNAPLLFSQENMPYFRRKMVTEILEGALIT